MASRRRCPISQHGAVRRRRSAERGAGYAQAARRTSTSSGAQDDWPVALANIVRAVANPPYAIIISANRSRHIFVRADAAITYQRISAPSRRWPIRPSCRRSSSEGLRPNWLFAWHAVKQTRGCSPLTGARGRRHAVPAPQVSRVSPAGGADRVDPALRITVPAQQNTEIGEPSFRMASCTLDRLEHACKSSTPMAP